MKPASPPSTRMDRWNHFVRWFFNSSPTGMIDEPQPATHLGFQPRPGDPRRDENRTHKHRRTQPMHRATAR